MRLEGQGILITGASHGLGKAIADACLAEGAHLFLCARGADALEQARAELTARARPGQVVRAQVADVSRSEDIAALTRAATRELPRLDGLVNNAGVSGPSGLAEEVGWDEWVQTLAVNLLGPVQLCRAVLPHFRSQGAGRIVNLSGGGATSPLPRRCAYAVSKAAVVRFTEVLAEETKGTAITVNAVAPGAMNTKMLDDVLAAGPEKVGEDTYRRSLEQKQRGGAPPERAAALCVFLLSDASEGITGRLLSAVWDPWEQLPGRLGELAGSDIYTLRRIIPEDRGLAWGEP